MIEHRQHPPTVLRSLLADFRAAGLPFDEAWPLAVDAALAAAPPSANDVERSQWRSAFTATESSWRRHYNGEPSEDCDSAITTLAADADPTLARLREPAAMIA